MHLNLGDASPDRNLGENWVVELGNASQFGGSPGMLFLEGYMVSRGGCLQVPTADQTTTTFGVDTFRSHHTEVAAAERVEKPILGRVLSNPSSSD